MRNIKNVINEIDSVQIDNILNKIESVMKNNKKIFVVAAGRTNLIMRTFAMRLMQIGFKSHVVFDTTTPAIESGDLLIAASSSGTTPTVVSICSQAVNRNAKVVLLTKNENSDLVSKIEKHLIIPCDYANMKVQSNGSTFEQTLLIFLDNLSVELMIRLGYISDLNEIDGLIRVRHANLQ
ncbi:MAG: SIS domain-containing protein [Erysipelotrichaceae bacterium]